MGVEVGGADWENWEPPPEETRTFMRRELLRLRRLEAFRRSDLTDCTYLAGLPVVLAEARREHHEPWQAIPKVIEAALTVLVSSDTNAQALQSAYGFTVSGRTATERREKYLLALGGDPRINTEEGLKSREEVGALTLLTYLIDESETLVKNPADGEPYWKALQGRRRQFRALTVINQCRLGPDGQFFEAQWDGIYRIVADGVTEFSNPYNLLGGDAHMEIEVEEGGTYQGIISHASSQGEIRWGMRLHREMNTGDTVRLRWRGHVTPTPGGRPLPPIFVQQTEVVLPWLRQEVYFHPDRLPKVVGKARGPVSGWPQRCEDNMKVDLDPDLCARAPWIDLEPEDAMGLYWEWE